MRKGFTLLEALVSLALTTILIYGASAAFLNLAPKYRLRKATWEIQTRLNYARYRAIYEGRAVRVRFHPAGYTIEKYNDNTKSWQPDIAGAVEGVQVQANNSPTFYPAGTVSNLATIIVTNSYGKYRISIAISGRVRAAIQ
jgi:Tfp pilus assembly protein FimT